MKGAVTSTASGSLNWDMMADWLLCCKLETDFGVATLAGELSPRVTCRSGAKSCMTGTDSRVDAPWRPRDRGKFGGRAEDRAADLRAVAGGGRPFCR